MAKETLFEMGEPQEPQPAAPTRLGRGQARFAARKRWSAAWQRRTSRWHAWPGSGNAPTPG